LSIKVLYIIPEFGFGGAEKFLINLVKALKRTEQIEPKIVFLFEKNLPKYSYIECVNVNVRLSLFRKNKIFVDELINVVKSFEPNIIHSHIFYAELISRANLFKGIKYISHIHGITTQYEKFPSHGFFKLKSYTNFYEKKYILKQYKICDNKFIVVSKQLKKYLVQNIGVKESTVEVFHNAIDLNKFKPQTSKKSKKLKLISIGRLDKNKGHDLLINVVKELQATFKEIELKILGEGSQRPALEALIKTLQLEKNVFLMGNIENPQTHLQKADVFLHASKYESFGIVFLEAMACGVPIITTNGEGNMDITMPNYNSIVVDRNTVDFTNAVVSIMENKKEYEKIRANGLSFVKKYHICEYASRLIEYYKDIIENDKRKI